MEGGGNLMRIETLARALIDQGMLATAVEQELNKYRTRRNQLMEPVTYSILY